MANQFQDVIGRLTASVTGSTAGVGDVDVSVGSVLRDAALAPFAFEQTGMYQQIDTVSANQGLLTAAGQSDASLENIASNFNITRSTGTYATGTVRFYRYSQPISNIPIVSGSKIYSELSSSQVSFHTLATVYLAPSSPVDSTTGAYYVDIAIICDVAGAIGNVFAGGISYSEITGVDEVSNLVATTGGLETQTNNQLVSTIQATARGNIGTRSGWEALVRDNFIVADCQVIGGKDVDSVRSQFGGSVDIIVLDETLSPMTELLSYTGATGSTGSVAPTFRPLASVVGIGATGATAGPMILSEGPANDYEVVYDNYSINRRSSSIGSTGEQSKIIIHSSVFELGMNPTLAIQYYHTASILAIQNFIDSDDNKVFGSDVMVKAGIKVPANVTANIVLLPGYSATIVINAVQVALLAYFNTLLLNKSIQASDVTTVIGNVVGVDSIDLSTFRMANADNPSVALQAINVNKQGYIRLANAYIAAV